MTRRHWTATEDATVRRLYSDTPTAQLARQLGRPVGSVYQRAYLLGLHKSDAYLASPAAGRTNGRQGMGTRFPKGHVPANKGLRGRKGWAPGRMAEGQFKKGVRQGVAVRLYKPIGTERVCKDGYLQRKVNDDLPLQARWKFVHLIVWEAAHGPVPTGHAITFINGDRRDLRIENLACVSRADLMRRNTVHNLPKPLASAIQLLGALKRQVRRRDGAQQDQRST